MLFGSRKRRKSAGGVSHPIDPARNQTPDSEFVPWRVWRCATQKTTRAWNEWLAADGRERSELYRRYVCALEEEEQAAVAIEQAVSREATARSARDRASESEHELAG